MTYGLDLAKHKQEKTQYRLQLKQLASKIENSYPNRNQHKNPENRKAENKTSGRTHIKELKRRGVT